MVNDQTLTFYEIERNTKKIIMTTNKKQKNKSQSVPDDASQKGAIQKKENNTGLPNNLKSAIENLSGYSMDDVKVHYNSSKPRQLQAHAYAQGTEVHLAPGQEKHLPHEAWDVVQQKQGRVKPTTQLKGKVNVNDYERLEKEADVMGSKALSNKKPNKYRLFSLFKRKKTKIDSALEEDSKGVIGRFKENDNPVIVRFVNEIPNEHITSKLSFFTVVAWKYDGSENNGMPTNSINTKMIKLENTLESVFKLNEVCRHAYNRTGNNLKEFNYYINDRDEFMKHFNHALRNHEQYPIEVSFYEDPKWTEFKKLIEDFK